MQWFVSLALKSPNGERSINIFQFNLFRFTLTWDNFNLRCLKTGEDFDSVSQMKMHSVRFSKL